MGQAKFNPKHLAAKRGELHPKKPGMSKRQRDAILYRMVAEKTGATNIMRHLTTPPLY